jgi:hypothetical protein
LLALNVLNICALEHDEENDPPKLTDTKVQDSMCDAYDAIDGALRDSGLTISEIAVFQPPSGVGVSAPATRFNAFHWPDHVIGKRESRRIRDAHNDLYNSHHELLTALVFVLPSIRGAYEQDSDWSGDLTMVENAIERATRPE